MYTPPPLARPQPARPAVRPSTTRGQMPDEQRPKARLNMPSPDALGVPTRVPVAVTMPHVLVLIVGLTYLAAQCAIAMLACFIVMLSTEPILIVTGWNQAIDKDLMACLYAFVFGAAMIVLLYFDHWHSFLKRIISYI